MPLVPFRPLLRYEKCGENRPMPLEQRTLSEEVLQDIIHRIVQAVAPEKIILFGSAVRGEMGPDSDVDLLIVKSNSSPRKV
jgi:predicted nucleotidyltransferase